MQPCGNIQNKILCRPTAYDNYLDFFWRSAKLPDLVKRLFFPYRGNFVCC